MAGFSSFANRDRSCRFCQNSNYILAEGKSWYVDETDVKVHGKWGCYLSRAIDAESNQVDSRLSEKRDMNAAQQFFKQAMAVIGHAPEFVTTDGHGSYPRAVHETMGNDIVHRTNVHLNNRREQDHRGINLREYPMHGFRSFATGTRFCRAFDELRNYLRPRHTMGELVSLQEQRRAFLERLAVLKAFIQTAS